MYILPVPVSYLPCAHPFSDITVILGGWSIYNGDLKEEKLTVQIRKANNVIFF
jgi:hypothetical protein